MHPRRCDPPKKVGGTKRIVMEEEFFEDDETNTRFSGRTVTRILQQVVPYWRLVVFFLSLVVLITISDSIFTYFGKQLVDDAILPQDPVALRSILTNYAILSLVSAGIVFGFIFITGLLGEKVRYDLRRKLFHHLQELTFSYFDKTAVGWIMSRVTSDTERIADLVTWGLLDVTLSTFNILTALFFMSQGVIQNLDAYSTFDTVTGGSQTLGMGPVASQEAIKLLGTNGGGFFNVNSSMPFENPTGLTNFVQILLILIIPAGLTATFGRMAGSRRQGWVIYAAMMILFIVAVGVVYSAESHGSVAQHLAGINGGNMEGKETRFGIADSSLFAAVTTVASCGAVNASMESMTALGGGVPMANIMTGEVIFGGVGSGLYGMLLMVLLAVFLAGLMVGRTPEYLGKQIGAREVKLVVIGTLATPLAMLAGTGLAIATKWGAPSIYSSGPQGFSETLYAYVSQGGNNGSAFAGYTGFLQPNGDNVGAFGITFANLAGAAVMMAGRYIPILAVLAIGGAMVGRRVAPEGAGTFRTDTPTFMVLLIGVVLLVALLTFVPALLLGPVVQALSDGTFQ